MFEGMSDATLLRIGIAVAAVVLILVILFTSREKPGQGKRTAVARPPNGDRRQEPTLREILEAEAADAGPSSLDADEMAKMERALDARGDAPRAAEAGDPSTAASPAATGQGARPSHDFDKIVTLFIAARAGSAIAGPDLVVAAEKAGLVFGHRNIFHRMVDQHPEQGPIFSVANLVKPGYFDLREIQSLRTPGISFFMTLPGPLPALDAWDTLLPTAQRMAELLDGVLLDADRNALGRQRVANIRDELRAYDRQREKLTIKPGR
jgi:cell division protein ZipA